MQLRFLRTCKRRIRLPVFRLRNLIKEKFECPICIYRGPFEDVNPPSGPRKHARCPRCGSFERHRLQYLALQLVLDGLNTAQMKMLHFAPEVFFKDFFSKRLGTYETADLHMKGVDHKVDLENLPFSDSTYDLVFASHVLEHVPNDKKAIQEIRRILKPHGIAILPVPLVAESTIEYPEPNPHESYHVRAPGVDYFDRYTPYFSRIEKYASDSLPERYQLFTYEDRSRWPTVQCPLRPAMEGDRHIDIVPVCYV
jgi:SAM-dependent methyltransferase